MYIKSLILTLFLLVTSCVQYERIPQLHKEVKYQLHLVGSRTYELDVYDCSNMSFDLAVNLCRKGYDARILGYSTGAAGYYHAVVEVIVEGTAWYLDPSRGPRSYTRKKPDDTSILFVWNPRQFIYHAEGPRFRERILEDYMGHLKDGEQE